MSAAASGSAICATMPHSSSGGKEVSDSQIPALGTCGDSRAPQHPLGGSGTRGDTATLTEAEGLSPDPHHPPQLPCRAGQQEVTGEAGRDG